MKIFLSAFLLSLTAALFAANDPFSLTPQERSEQLRALTLELNATDSEIERTKISLQRLEAYNSENAEAIAAHKAYLAKLTVNHNLYAVKISELRKDVKVQPKNVSEIKETPLVDAHRKFIADVEKNVPSTTDSFLEANLPPAPTAEELAEKERTIMKEVKGLDNAGKNPDKKSNPERDAERMVMESELHLAEHKLNRLRENAASKADIDAAAAEVEKFKTELKKLQ